MKRPKYVVRLLAVIALLSMMLVGTAATATAQVTEDVEFPDLLTGDFNEIYFAAVGNGEDFGLGAAQTSITVQNIDDEDGFIFIFVGTGDDYEEATYAQLNAGASKTFTADDLGIEEGTVAPVIVAGYDTLGFDETIVDDYIGIAGVAKQAVTGDSLPYTTANDTSVSGYNSVSGREVGFQDELYLPIVQTNCGPGGCWDTVIRVSNVGFFENAAATIRFFPADDGSGSLQTGFQIEALLGLGETWSVNLSELVPEGWVGSAHIFSDDQVVAIADRFKAGTDMWITNTASNAYAESEYQFGAPYVLFAPDVRLDYNGWNTGINVANTVDMDNQVNIQYFGNNGNAPQGQSQRLAAQGMTYFYNPSDPSEDDCNQPADQVPTCDFVGGAVIISTSPVSVAVDGVKYFGNDENVGQAFSYAATANVFQFQAAPLVQKGTASTGMGDTSGINFMNPNSEATFVVVDWVNPSGFQADNFGDSVVWVPGFSTGFVYTMFQVNLPNGFTGSAIVTSELPIAATTANVNYAVNGDGTVVWNLYNPCGFFRQLGDCVFVPAPEPLATKVIDTEEAGALVCVYNQGVEQDGKPTPIDANEEDCELLDVAEKDGEEPGQGEPTTFFATLGGDSIAAVSLDEGTNEFAIDVTVDDLDAQAEVAVGIFGGTGNAVCGDATNINDGAAFFGTEVFSIDEGGFADDEGDFETGFEGTLTGEELAAIGDLEETVIVAFDPETGEILACGQIETGTVRPETFEEAAVRLGAVAVGVTDADGNVEFDLPAGDYFAVVNAEGFEIAVEEFSLEPGETEVNEVLLEVDVVNPPPADTVKIIDTNVEGALVCVYERGVDQDGKPIEVVADEDDCEILAVADKDGGDGGQGGADTFFSLNEDGSVAVAIAFDEFNNEFDVDLVGTDDDDEFDVYLAGFAAEDENGVYQPTGANATCTDIDDDDLYFVEIDNGAASGEDVAALGDFEDSIVVVYDAEGEVAFCGQVESGTVRAETLEEAAARLGAVAIGITDENGNVAFELEPGDYYAVINAAGFDIAIEEFTLTEGETETNVVQLVDQGEVVEPGTLAKLLLIPDELFGETTSIVTSEVIFCEGVVDAEDCNSPFDEDVVFYGGFDTEPTTDFDGIDGLDDLDPSDFGVYVAAAQVAPGEYTICSSVTVDFDGDFNTLEDQFTYSDMCENEPWLMLQIGEDDIEQIDESDEIELISGEQITVVSDELTVVVNIFSSLDVFVRDDVTDAPIAGATVCLYEGNVIAGDDIEADADAVTCTETGEDGIARFFGVSDGTYTVNSSARILVDDTLVEYESEATVVQYSVFGIEIVDGTIQPIEDTEGLVIDAEINGLLDDQFTADVVQALDPVAAPIP